MTGRLACHTIKYKIEYVINWQIELKAPGHALRKISTLLSKFQIRSPTQPTSTRATYFLLAATNSEKERSSFGLRPSASSSGLIKVLECDNKHFFPSFSTRLQVSLTQRGCVAIGLLLLAICLLSIFQLQSLLHFLHGALIVRFTIRII